LGTTKKKSLETTARPFSFRSFKNLYYFLQGWPLPVPVGLTLNRKYVLIVMHDRELRFDATVRTNKIQIFLPRRSPVNRLTAEQCLQHDVI